MANEQAALIGVDWGSTRVRVHAIADHGRIVASRQCDRGMASLASPAEFAAVLHDLLNDDIDQPSAPILIAGMAGARGGWREVPYAALPAGPEHIARTLQPLDLAGRRAAIVPGACTASAPFSDVMRGEETQALGLPAAARCAVAPGTHSKWIRLADGRIDDFATYPTGELYAVLMQHSLIGRGLPADAWSEPAFVQGIHTAQDDPDWLHQLFGVRARQVRDTMPTQELPAFLSGLLIGHECKAALASRGDDDVILVGAGRICELYARALREFHITTSVVDGDAAFCQGLWRIHQATNPT